MKRHAEKGLQDDEPRFVIGVFNYVRASDRRLTSKPFRKPFPNAAAMQCWMESEAFSHFEVYSIERIRMQHAERDPFPWPTKRMCLLMLGNVILYLAFCSFLYLSYLSSANAMFGIIVIGVVGLVAAGLKIAEWRRTWPFRPVPPLLELPPPPKDEPFRPTHLQPRRDQAES